MGVSKARKMSGGWDRKENLRVNECLERTNGVL
jgi:hypothetical protein